MREISILVLLLIMIQHNAPPSFADACQNMWRGSMKHPGGQVVARKPAPAGETRAGGNSSFHRSMLRLRGGDDEDDLIPQETRDIAFKR